MAFSSRQQHEIVRLLGWPGKTLLSSSTHYNNTVVSRLTNLNADIESEVTALLAKIAKIDAALESALCRLQAKKVDTIETNPDEIPMLKRERMRLLRELSDLLDIQIIKTGGGQVSVVV